MRLGRRAFSDASQQRLSPRLRSVDLRRYLVDHPPPVKRRALLLGIDDDMIGDGGVSIHAGVKAPGSGDSIMPGAGIVAVSG